MSSVPFKAIAGLEVEGDLKLATLPTGTPASAGMILSLSSTGITHYRTFSEMKTSTDSGRLDGVLAGSGLTVSSLQSAGVGTDTQTITLGTPDTLSVSTTDAATTTSHTHALTSSNDTSGAIAPVILSANSSGGVKVEELDINSGSLKLTDHVSAPAVTANKLYANTTSLFWENNDVMVGTAAANQQFVSGIAIAMAIALG
jgi:hypothetical protein